VSGACELRELVNALKSLAERLERLAGELRSVAARHEELVAALSRLAEAWERLARVSEKEYREMVRRYLVERARTELEVGGDMQRCEFYSYSACFTPESVRCRVECAAELLWAMHYSKWITDEEHSRVATLRLGGRVEEFVEEVCRLVERFRRNWEATVWDERRRGMGGRGARFPPPWCEKARAPA
jgi:hypothetical protein